TGSIAGRHRSGFVRVPDDTPGAAGYPGTPTASCPVGRTVLTRSPYRDWKPFLCLGRFPPNFVRRRSYQKNRRGSTPVVRLLVPSDSQRESLGACFAQRL